MAGETLSAGAPGEIRGPASFAGEGPPHPPPVDPNALGHPRSTSERWQRFCEDCKLKYPSFGLRDERKGRWCGPCAKAQHPGAIDVMNRKCQICGLKSPSFGMPSEHVRRWCRDCSVSQPGSVDLCNRKCEDCKIKSCTYGMLTGGRRKRWCAACAKHHPGSVISSHKKCATCDRVCSWGLPSDKVKKWCGGCAAAQPGAVHLGMHACETCLRRGHPTWGLLVEGKMRWCQDCASQRSDAVNLKPEKAYSKPRKKGKTMCEDCGASPAKAGMPSADGKAGARWCLPCAEAHPGSVHDPKKPRCEFCTQNLPAYALPSEGVARWCAQCAFSMVPARPPRAGGGGGAKRATQSGARCSAGPPRGAACTAPSATDALPSGCIICLGTGKVSYCQTLYTRMACQVLVLSHWVMCWVWTGCCMCGCAGCRCVRSSLRRLRHWRTHMRHLHCPRGRVPPAEVNGSRC